MTELPKQPSIYDVAAAAGVSASTVSRAFARPGRVSHQTAQRIFDAATAIGYRSAHMPGFSRAAGRHTSMIAVVIADIRNPVYAEIVRGAEAAASESGYITLLAHTQESEVRERQALERVLPMVDGIVLSSSRMSDSAIRMLAKQKPMVVMNRAVKDVASVVTDNARGIRRAAEHLAELGHRNITYLAGPEASWVDGMRWRSLREAASELGLSVRRTNSSKPTIGGGEALATEWLQRRTSAVIAYNDQMAIGFMRGLTQARVQVPGEVSVVGFDNSYGAALVTPALTTVETPLYSQGATAVNNLLAFAAGAKSRSNEPVVLPARLAVRNSTGPAAE
ncbi:LacI family DNA-binding transcriptional regulator [Glutamicibacter sp. AOP38-B1-38]|uniref:LacI family DNA-binding transcriptional regulator n=1 Tax=unclassified Glutamicibacter TaxID=2627139 RepID=UPI001C3F04DE|nr:LacI family DNA-binding transcriptional regulator [Glutamicibacter sp. BW80]